MNAFQALWTYRQAFEDGLIVTGQLVGLAVVLGTVLGALMEWLCSWTEDEVRPTFNTLAFGVSAVPALVLLFWLYYPAQTLFHLSLSAFWTAVITLTLINGLAVYRIIGDAKREFPRQFVQSGLVCGLSRQQILRFIELPLLLRALLPRWLDQQVAIAQLSVFASLISVGEIFRQAQLVNSKTYQPVVIYTAMALVFLLILGAIMAVSQIARTKFQRDLSER